MIFTYSKKQVKKKVGIIRVTTLQSLTDSEQEKVPNSSEYFVHILICTDIMKVGTWYRNSQMSRDKCLAIRAIGRNILKQNLVYWVDKTFVKLINPELG